MWKDIEPSSRDYKIEKQQASWYKLVIRHAQADRYRPCKIPVVVFALFC